MAQVVIPRKLTVKDRLDIRRLRRWQYDGDALSEIIADAWLTRPHHVHICPSCGAYFAHNAATMDDDGRCLGCRD